MGLCAALAATGPFTAAELEAHRNWMDDAQERREEVREALPSKDQKKLLEGAKALEQLTVREEAFWARTNLKEARQIASLNRSQAKELLQSAQAGRFEVAQRVLTKLERTCASCHDLHFEKEL